MNTIPESNPEPSAHHDTRPADSYRYRYIDRVNAQFEPAPDLGTLRDTTYLLALILAARVYEPFRTVGPLHPITRAPHEELPIFTGLQQRGLIQMSHQTPFAAFVLADDGRIQGYKPLEAVWTLRLDRLPFCLKSAIAGTWWPDAWHEEVLALWLEVAEKQALAYAWIRKIERGITLSDTPDIRAAFATLVKDYSIGQVFSLIRSSFDHVAADTGEATPYGRDSTEPLRESCLTLHHLIQAARRPIEAEHGDVAVRLTLSPLNIAFHKVLMRNKIFGYFDVPHAVTRKLHPYDEQMVEVFNAPADPADSFF